MADPVDNTVQLQHVWRQRAQQAREAQKPHVAVWLSNLAFAAGQHWLVWDDNAGGRLRHIKTMDPRYRDRILYTADRITEYRMAQLAELSSDDDRPQLLTGERGETGEQAARALNQAVAHQWEHESDTQTVLESAHQMRLDVGTVAVRRRFDPDRGPVVGHQPLDPAGRPVTPDTHPADYQALQTAGTLADGTLPAFKPVREGRSVLELYPPFGILSPPGVPREQDFPWEVLVRPVPVADVIARYPAAAGMQEDGDIASALGLTTGQTVRDGRSQGGVRSRLRDHVWFYTCFYRPCADHPDGYVALFASDQFTLLELRPTLDYRLADGEPHSGVVYLHWWQLNDRFYSRAFIEPLKDPQRAINEVETMKAEIVRRGAPKVLVKKGAVPEPTGAPVEILEVDDLGAAPVVMQGIGPGDWMNVEKAGHIDNLAHASTLSQIRIGENPDNVQTYSQLALINENESAKRAPIIADQKRKIATLVELGVHDIRRYWPERKLILVTGDDGAVDRVAFEKARIPDFFMFRAPTGAPQPRSQAAELKKIDAIWAAATQSGLAAHDPEAWTAWYVESLAAGAAQELPARQRSSQREFAAFENLLMRQGEQPPVMDYDLMPEHLPEHRDAMDQARAAGDTRTLALLNQHVQEHVQMAQQNAAQIQQAQQAPSPLAPTAAAGPDAGAMAGLPFAANDFLRLAAGNP